MKQCAHCLNGRQFDLENMRNQANAAKTFERQRCKSDTQLRFDDNGDRKPMLLLPCMEKEQDFKTVLDGLVQRSRNKTYKDCFRKHSSGAVFVVDDKERIDLTKDLENLIGSDSKWLFVCVCAETKCEYMQFEKNEK